MMIVFPLLLGVNGKSKRCIGTWTFQEVWVPYMDPVVFPGVNENHPLGCPGRENPDWKGGMKSSKSPLEFQNL